MLVYLLYCWLKQSALVLFHRVEYLPTDVIMAYTARYARAYALHKLSTVKSPSTQPPALSETENEYRPRGDNALRLGSKAGWFIPSVDKCVGGR